MTNETCPACGSSHADRADYIKRMCGNEPTPTGLYECRFCEDKKCCMCDMGHDVRCLNCENADELD